MKQEQTAIPRPFEPQVATGTVAAGNVAAGNVATGNVATGSGATGSGATGSGAIGSGAIGSVMPYPDVGEGPPRPDSLWATWTAGWRHAAAFSSARSALSALLRARGVASLWLPAYCCTALLEAAGATVSWYGVDDTLEPDCAMLADRLLDGDAVVGIDYFGRPPAASFRALVASRPGVLWIEDRAQALDPGGIPWGHAVLYSPRKLVGVADGALLLSDAPLPKPAAAAAAHADAAQVARRADPDGKHPDRWFPQFQLQEAAFAVDDAPMSARTRHVLERLPAAPLSWARAANADILRDRLGPLNLWPSNAWPLDAWPPGTLGEAPFAVPVRLRNRDAVAAALAAERIYCAKHWAAMPSDPAAFPREHRLAGALLSLPCDDRYGAADMLRIIDALTRAGAQPPLSHGTRCRVAPAPLQ